MKHTLKILLGSVILYAVAHGLSGCVAEVGGPGYGGGWYHDGPWIDGGGWGGDRGGGWGGGIHPPSFRR